jgi:PQQ-dependent dehydrogenase (s-GDH family)
MPRILLPLILLCSFSSFGQYFYRTELPTQLTSPWEITMGPDGYLWLTEKEGKVSRVDPSSGAKQEVYAAPDYFSGDSLEQWAECTMPLIYTGTHGLALHPDFLNAGSSFIYFVYTYNHGTVAAPKTKFKIVRLTWDASSETVTQADDIVLNMPTGYDHFGGRLISATMSGSNYLLFSIGDLGISEDNHPDCYVNQADNPNNFTQDPDSLNGKIHRFNMDGSIPLDNPIPGNSFYTRGHRNPQGLAFNPNQEIIYEIEHGDNTDDEINILESGMNYGWKHVRGYHFDGSHVGEDNYVNNYAPDPSIVGDQLVEPIYSWCTDTTLNGTGYLNWCTVAPSDGEYYNSDVIYPWHNSLAVVTLKDGDQTDREVHVMHLSEDGTSVDYTTKAFGEDQALNGRLRDITFSLDGSHVFLINNGGADRDKITVYTFVWDPEPPYYKFDFMIYPNPSNGYYGIISPDKIVALYVYDLTGKLVFETIGEITEFQLDNQSHGLYQVKAITELGEIHCHKIIKL